MHIEQTSIIMIPLFRMLMSRSLWKLIFNIMGLKILVTQSFKAQKAGCKVDGFEKVCIRPSQLKLVENLRANFENSRFGDFSIFEGSAYDVVVKSCKGQKRGNIEAHHNGLVGRSPGREVSRSCSTILLSRRAIWTKSCLLDAGQSMGKAQGCSIYAIQNTGITGHSLRRWLL